MHRGLGPGVAHMEAERPSTSPIGALSLVKKFTKFPGGMPERPPGQPSGAAQALRRDAQTGGAAPGLKGVRAGAHAGAHHGPGAVGAGRQTAPVNLSTGAGRRTPEKQLWERCSARPAAGTTTTGRARWGGLAGVISVGTESAGALVLADLPERTCFLPEELLFVRWAGAGSEGALLTAARATPGDPGRPRHRLGGVRGLGHRRSCCADGLGRGRHRPGGGAHRGVPDQAPVPLPAGRWRVLAARRTDTDPGVDVVRLTADQA
ncbi:hypothetical protein M2168_002252 [Streptomyces sp. CZ24]|nr:hypothetical protein [Streptomyces sp. CZ24]